jgi:hypothetical protein
LGVFLIIVSNGDPDLPTHTMRNLQHGTAPRHFPGSEPDTFRLPTPSPAEIARRLSPERIEELLQLTISNQRAEGIYLSPDEIDEVRRRLRTLASQR